MFTVYVFGRFVMIIIVMLTVMERGLCGGVWVMKTGSELIVVVIVRISLFLG